jgi:hypothetical protein
MHGRPMPAMAGKQPEEKGLIYPQFQQAAGMKQW